MEFFYIVVFFFFLGQRQHSPRADYRKNPDLFGRIPWFLHSQGFLCSSSGVWPTLWTHPGPNEDLLTWGWIWSSFVCGKDANNSIYVGEERWYSGGGKVAQAADLALEGRMGWGSSHQKSSSRLLSPGGHLPTLSLQPPGSGLCCFSLLAKPQHWTENGDFSELMFMTPDVPVLFFAFFQAHLNVCNGLLAL